MCFGPTPKDNFIMNVKTQERIPMQRERGTFVIDVGYLVNSVETQPASFTRQAAR